MSYLYDKMSRAIYEDDYKTLREILDEDKSNINEKDSNLKDTLLHTICRYGAELCFDVVYPQLKKARLNMFNKSKQTPFYIAISGPSDKIFEKLLKDPNVEVNRCQDKDTYGGSNRHRYEPIFSLISKPEFKHRVSLFFSINDDIKTTWASWFGYSMWQKQLWALELVLENGEYDKFEDYTKRGGMRSAITFDNKVMIERLVNYDSHILEPGEQGNTPIGEGLKIKGRFEYLLSLMPSDLSKTQSGKPYDDLIREIKNYKPEIAEEHFKALMKRNLFISDGIIITMMSNQYTGKSFFEACIQRNDYDTRIVPLLKQNGAYDNFMPQAVKDLFLF